MAGTALNVTTAPTWNRRLRAEHPFSGTVVTSGNSRATKWVQNTLAKSLMIR